MIDTLVAAITWLDYVKVCAALVAPALLLIRGFRKLFNVLSEILASVERLGVVEIKVNTIDADVKHLASEAAEIKLDATEKHRENTSRLDNLTSHVANQQSTSRMLAEEIGAPLAVIASVFADRKALEQPPHPPRRDTDPPETSFTDRRTP